MPRKKSRNGYRGNGNESLLPKNFRNKSKNSDRPDSLFDSGDSDHDLDPEDQWGVDGLVNSVLPFVSSRSMRVLLSSSLSKVDGEKEACNSEMGHAKEQFLMIVERWKTRWHQSLGLAGSGETTKSSWKKKEVSNVVGDLGLLLKRSKGGDWEACKSIFKVEISAAAYHPASRRTSRCYSVVSVPKLKQFSAGGLHVVRFSWKEALQLVVRNLVEKTLNGERPTGCLCQCQSGKGVQSACGTARSV